MPTRAIADRTARPRYLRWRVSHVALLKKLANPPGPPYLARASNDVTIGFPTIFALDYRPKEVLDLRQP